MTNIHPCDIIFDCLEMLAGDWLFETEADFVRNVARQKVDPSPSQLIFLKEILQRHNGKEAK